MIIRKLLLILLFLLILPIAAFAHPHLAIFSSCEFQFNGSELEGVWVEFRFDRYFSADIISGYDVDQNKTFDKSETEQVYQNAFINLQNYGFFIFIRDEYKRTSPEEVKNFSLYIDGDDIIYRFFVELENPDNGEIYLSVCDPTFFCATYYEEENPVIFKDAQKVQADYHIVENTDYPVHYDPMASANNSNTYDKWKPGLQTFFPQEIHLVF